MPKRNGTHVVIVGAGLGGALMARYLAAAGYRVDIYERRSDPRDAGVMGGRSINLAISTRGLTALRDVGLESAILSRAVDMPGRMIHDRDGGLTFQPYGRTPAQCIHSVSRAGLNLALLRAADGDPGIRMFFDHRCVNVDPDHPRVMFQHTITGETIQTEADFVVGADGAFSAVRARLQRLERFDYRQDYLEYGYKELCIPPGPGGSFLMEKNALHIWPRSSYMMIALPNVDGSYTCTCFWPYEGPNGFASLQTGEQIFAYFRRQFPDAVPLMPTLVEDYQSNPVGSLVTVRCAPWYYRDKVVLLGDAAHAVVPFYGQGANASFEDCTVLASCLRESPDDRARAFTEYHARRKENCDALAQLAIDNFVEMRDKTARRSFRFYKKAEKALHKLAPAWYLPLYTMVTFTTIPYAQAARRAMTQDRIVLTIAMVLVLLLLMAAAWLLK